MRILIFNDAPEYGGHERCTLDLARALKSRSAVTALHLMLADPDFTAAARLSGLEVSSCTAAPQPWAGLLAYAHGTVAELESRFAVWRPDCVLLSQGNIEFAIRALIAARRLKIPVWSYIPMCQSLTEQESRWGALRDLLAARHYRQLSGFVVISPLQERYVRRWIGPEIPVLLLEHLIDTARYPRLPPRPPSAGLELACIGRIRFKQKGQDRLLSLAKLLRQQISDPFRISVIGDGPDRTKLESLVQEAKLEKFFRFTGWINDLRETLEGLDMVLSVSHFEGVPLVMIESLLSGRPFFGPAWPGIENYLTEDLVFENLEEASDKIRAFFQKPIAVREALLTQLRADCVARHGSLAYADRVDLLLGQIRTTLLTGKKGNL